jgi:anti-sigma regulatory factor (Ser/Thr protein kinase)
VGVRDAQQERLAMIGGTGTVTGRTTPHRPRLGSGASPAFHFVSALELAPLHTAIPCFRLHTVAILREWGLPRDLVEDAQMVVRELMTNALDASAGLPERPPITLRLLATGKSLVIEAWDQSPLDLEPRQADADDECGRGLTVVATLSDRWGWERTGYRRKVVWAELAL